MQVAGQDAARIFHLHGGGEALAAGGRAAVEHAHAGRRAGGQHGQLCGGVLHIDRAGLEQRQRFEIARAGDEEAAGKPRVRLTGDPRFVQRGSHLLCRCLQGICLKRRFGNVVVGGEEGFERFLVHGRTQAVDKRLRVRVFRGQIVRLFQLVLSAGKGAQRTVDQTGGAFVRIGLRLLDRFIDGGRDGDLIQK